jgi:hypothetical protein
MPFCLSTTSIQNASKKHCICATAECVESPGGKWMSEADRPRESGCLKLTTGWIAVGVALLLLLGFGLIMTGRSMRQGRGLGGGRTVSLDRVTLTSHRLGLTGRPDRLIKTDGTIIVEEWNSWS